MPTQFERKVLPLRGIEVKSAQENGLPTWFSGHAAAFFVPDQSQFTDIIAPGAFAEGLERFLERGFTGGLNHNWDEPIGRPLKAVEDGDGLYVESSLSHTQHGQDVARLLADGVLRFLSIGFIASGILRLQTPEEVATWWRGVGYSPEPADVAAVQKGARLLTRIELYEFSPVTVPACWAAEIAGVKGSPRGDDVPGPWQEAPRCEASGNAAPGHAAPGHAAPETGTAEPLFLAALDRADRLLALAT